MPLLWRFVKMLVNLSLRRSLTLSLVAVTFMLTGCGAIIRHAVNKKLPSISPEQRQLGAIEVSQKNLGTLSSPNSYAFIPASDLINYVDTVAVNPAPLNSAAQQ